MCLTKRDEIRAVLHDYNQFSVNKCAIVSARFRDRILQCGQWRAKFRGFVDCESNTIYRTWLARAAYHIKKGTKEREFRTW